MKNLGTILSVLALAGVIYLLITSGETGNTSSETEQSEQAIPTGSLKMVYIDIDSLVKHSEIHQYYQGIIQDKAKAVELELKRRETAFQDNISTLQKYAASMTDQQLQQSQLELQQKQQEFLAYQDERAQELAAEQQEYSLLIRSELDTVLLKIRERDGYDFILTYGPTSDIIAANPAYDITDIVVKELNEAYQNKEEEVSEEE